MNNIKNNKSELSPEQRDELLEALKARFEENIDRHEGLAWAKVKARLEADAQIRWSLNHNGPESYYSGRGFRGSLRV